MLLKLVQAKTPEFSHSVVSLGGLGTIGPQLQRAGAMVIGVGLVAGKIPTFGALRLAKMLRDLNPDLIQGWMYHGNLAATFAHWFLRRPPKLLWTIRGSYDAAPHEKPLTRAVIRMGRVTSGRPSRTIYNSNEAKSQHLTAGFASRNADVIPNGFDLKRFHHNLDQRSIIRARLRLRDEEFVVGHIARVHPMKDQLSLLRACGLLVGRVPHLRVVAAGRDMERMGEVLPGALEPIRTLGSRLLLLPEQIDVAQLMPAFDAFVLSSAWGEGFPNVLGEAMATGVPCVATDIGDSREIVGDTGIIVPPRSPDQLALAILALASKGTGERAELSVRARRRVEKNYSLASVVRQYETIWNNEISQARA